MTNYSDSAPDGQEDAVPVACMQSTRDALTNEVRYFHKLLFGYAPSANYIEAYISAHMDLADLASSDEKQCRTVKLIVERRLDALGIDVFLRSRCTRHLLTRKLLLMNYLAECDPSYAEFLRGSTKRFYGFFTFCLVGFLMGKRLLHGRIQKKIHGLV